MKNSASCLTTDDTTPERSYLKKVVTQTDVPAMLRELLIKGQHFLIIAYEQADGQNSKGIFVN